MNFLGIKNNAEKIEIKEFNISVNSSKLNCNGEEYDFTINRNLDEEKVSIITNIKEKNNTFSKLLIHLSNKNNTLLSNSYYMFGNVIQTSYKEKEKLYLVDKNYYNILKNNFTSINLPIVYLHSFLLKSNYDLKNILNLNINELRLHENDLKNLENFNSKHKHSIDLNLDDNNNNLISSLFYSSYINKSANNKSQIIFNKEILNNYNSMIYDTNKKQIIVELNENTFYDNMYYLVKNIDLLEKLISENDLQNIEIKLPKIEKKEGCCGGGSCDKGSECCQNDKKEEQKSNGCCKNKPDSECCKKNPEIKCDKETCGNYESCCGSKEPLQEKREEIVETELRDLYEKMNLDINNPGFILFLKGSKEEPKCKFSKPAVAKLNSIELDYKGYNILENEQLRSTLKYIHPTYPQLYYNYKFVCGGDLINDKDHDSLKLFLEELKEK